MECNDCNKCNEWNLKDDWFKKASNHLEVYSSLIYIMAKMLISILFWCVWYMHVV